MQVYKQAATFDVMRVLGVIRLSRLTDETLSPEVQRKNIIAHCELHKHEIIGWAEDLDVSGSESPFKRDGFGPWLTEQRVGEYEGIIAWKIDRISRNMLDTATLIQWLTERSKVLMAVSDGLDTSTPHGRFFAQMMGLMAEYELETIRARILEGKKALRGTNRFAGGKIPYGYWTKPNPDGPGTVLEIDPHSAGVVQWMIDQIMRGYSMSAIREELQNRGELAPIDYVRQKKGEPTQGINWSVRAVSAILRSPTLLGQIEHKGKVVRGKDGLPIRRATALITHEEFTQLQVQLDRLSRQMVHKNPKALLADVALCASCGSKLYRQVQRRNGEIEHVYYRCGARNNSRVCPHPVGIRAAELEQAVADRFLAMMGDEERRERIWQRAEDYGADLAYVEQAIAELREEWDLNLYDGDRKSYLARLTSLVERKRELEVLPSRPGGYHYLPMGETYRMAWDRATTDQERRELLLSAGTQIHVADLNMMTVQLWVGSEEGHPGTELREEGE